MWEGSLSFPRRWGCSGAAVGWESVHILTASAGSAGLVPWLASSSALWLFLSPVCVDLAPGLAGVSLLPAPLLRRGSSRSVWRWVDTSFLQG